MFFHIIFTFYRMFFLKLFSLPLILLSITGFSTFTIAQQETRDSAPLELQELEPPPQQTTEQDKNKQDNAASNASTAESLLENRINNERDANRNLFSLSQHQQNYLLPVSYMSNPSGISLDEDGTQLIDNFEAKYQISVKTPLWLQKDDVSGVYFGFTAVSFWQIYNRESSKPLEKPTMSRKSFINLIVILECSVISLIYCALV